MGKGRFLFLPTNMVPVMVEDHGHDAGLCSARGRQGGPPSGGGGILGPSGARGGGTGEKTWGEEMGR